jgi:hypothetical protein
MLISENRFRVPPPTQEEEEAFKILEQKLGVVDVSKLHQAAVEASVLWIDNEDPRTLFTMSLRKIFEIGYIKGVQAVKK